MANPNKKKSEISSEMDSLPKLPSLSDSFGSPMTELGRYPNVLPSFPTSSLGEKMSREAIKSSIADSSLEYPELDETQNPEALPELPNNAKIPDFPNYHRPASKQMFVKLENYKKALEAFQELKSKTQEVSGLLIEIKEVKKREESELAGWEEELEEMKGKIEDIDKNLFSKID